MKINKILMWLTVLLLSILIVGCSGTETTTDDQASDDQKNQTETKDTDSSSTTDTDSDSDASGGELTIAVTAQPPVIDPHMTTANVAIEIARNIFEPLVTTNEQFQPTLMLADSVDVSDDGLTYTFHLREGITFHNGQEMTSEDVVASMNRWMEHSSRAQTYLSGATIEAEDDYTVVFTVQSYSTDVLEILSSGSQFPGIMPKEVIESASVEGVTEFIGTGPFKFEEWSQDQYIYLTKFDQYQSVDAEPSGLSGRKEALVDDVYFRFVSDTSTRLAGVQTGEYDIADLMPHDHYEQLSNMANIETHLAFDEGTHTLFFNKKSGLMADEKMRQAVNAALDNNAILLASYASEDLYMLDSNYMNPEQIDWATDAGSESYNQNDPEKAKSLLEEAGYNGETLVLMTSRDYDHHYNAAVVVQEQLEQIGMSVELEVYDWPTYTERRDDPELWDMITIGLGYSSTPAQQLSLDSNWVGWPEHPTIDELLDLTRTADTQEGAKQAWEELQGFLWNEYVPIVSFGHRSRIIATTDKVDGFRVFTGPILWNVSVGE